MLKNGNEKEGGRQEREKEKKREKRKIERKEMKKERKGMQKRQKKMENKLLNKKKSKNHQLTLGTDCSKVLSIFISTLPSFTSMQYGFDDGSWTCFKDLKARSPAFSIGHKTKFV